MKNKSKIITGIISAVGVSALIAGSVVGVSYSKSKSQSSTPISLNTKDLNVLSSNQELNNLNSNSQVLYSGLNTKPYDLVAKYNQNIPNGYHLVYQWYTTNSPTKKVISPQAKIFGANNAVLSSNEMGINISSSANNQNPYYYFVEIELVSNKTNKVVSHILSDIYTITISNSLDKLQVLGGTVVNTVDSSQSDGSLLLSNSNNKQTTLTASISMNIPSSLSISWQWYYSGTKQSFNIQGSPFGQPISLSSNPTANTSSLTLTNQELSNIGTYYYYVVLTVHAKNATKSITSSYYTVDVQKNTVIASISAQASSSNVVVNQKNFTNYQISLNPNISYTTQNNSTNFTYQWYRAPYELNTNNVEAFVNNYQEFLITSNENSTANQEIYYLNSWDSNVQANSTYYYYLLITGTTYGINIKPVLTTIPVTVTFDSTPNVTINGINGDIKILDTTTSYTLKPNINVSTSKLTATTSQVYQWYYSVNQPINTQEWKNGEVSLTNNLIQLTGISALNTINDANDSSFVLTQNNFIQSQYIGKTIYFYLIVAYSINGVVVSNLDVAKNNVPSAYTISVVSLPSPTIDVPSSTIYLTKGQTTNLPTLSPTIANLNNNIYVSYQWYVSNSADASYDSTTGIVTNASALTGITSSASYTLPISTTATVGVFYYYLLVQEIVQENGTTNSISVLSKPFEVSVVNNATLTFSNTSSTYKSEVNNNTPISLTANVEINLPNNTKLSDYAIKFAWFSSSSSTWTYSQSVANNYLAVNSDNNTYTLNKNGNGYDDVYTIDASYFDTAKTVYFYVVAFLTLNGNTTISQSSSVYTLVVANATNTSFNVTASSKTTQDAFVNQSSPITFSVAPSVSGYNNPTYKYEWSLIDGSNSQEVISTNTFYNVDNSTLEILPAFFSAAKNLVYVCVVSLYVNNKLIATSSQIIFNLNVYSNLNINLGSSSSPISVQPISDGSSIVSANSLNKTVIYGQSNNETLNITSYANALNANSSNVTLNNESYSYAWYTSNKDGAEVSAISSNSDYSVNNGTLVVNASNFSGNSFSNDTGTLYYLVVITLNNVEINAKAVTETVLISINVIAPPTFSFSNTQTNIDATVNETSYQTLTANVTYTTANAAFNNYQITYSWYKVVGNSDEQVANTSSYTLTANDVLKSPGSVKFYVIASVTINGKTYTSNPLDYTVTFVNQPTINLTPSLLNNTVFQNQNSVVTLSASVTSSSQNLSLSYQWFICDANGNNAIAISSSTLGYSGYNTNTLSINPSVYNDLTNSHALYFYLQVTSSVNGITIYQNNNQKSIYSLLVNGNLHYDTTANQTNSTISVYAQDNNVTLLASPSVVYEDYSVTPNTQATYNNVTFTYNWYETGNSTSLGTSNSFTIPSNLLTANVSFYYVATATINGVSLASSLGNYTSGKYNVDVIALPTITISANGANNITTIADNAPTSGFLASASVNGINNAAGVISNISYTWYKLDSQQIPNDVNATWVNNNKSNIVSTQAYFSDFNAYISTAGNYYFYCLATLEASGTTIYSTSTTTFNLTVLNKPVITVKNIGKTSVNLYQNQISANSFQVHGTVSYSTTTNQNNNVYDTLNYQWFSVPKDFVASKNTLIALMNGTLAGSSALNIQTNTYVLPISSLQTNKIGSTFYYFCVVYIKIGNTYYFAQNGSFGSVNTVTIYSAPTLNASGVQTSLDVYANTTNNVLQTNASVSAIGANDVSQILSISSYTYNWYQVESPNYKTLPSSPLSSITNTNNALSTYTIPTNLLDGKSSVLYLVCQVIVPNINGATLNVLNGLSKTVLFTINVINTPTIIITNNLSNQIAFNGQKNSVTFAITAGLNINSTTAILSYQWYESTINISNTTTANDGTKVGTNQMSYIISNPTNDTKKVVVTYYYVIVTASIPGYGKVITAVSNVASLTIYPTPSFTTSVNKSQNIYVAQTSNLPAINSSLTWNGNYNAQTALNASYQWYRSQVNGLSNPSSTSLIKISNATSLNYQLTSADSTLQTGNWYYYLVATYNLPGNSSISEIAQIGTIDILNVPTINVSSLNVTNDDGFINATFNEPKTNYQTLYPFITLSSNPGNVVFSYQWYTSSIDGLTSSDYTNNSLSQANLISGATNQSYTLSANDVSTLGKKYFYLIVSANIYGAPLKIGFLEFKVDVTKIANLVVDINTNMPTVYISQTSYPKLIGNSYTVSGIAMNSTQAQWYYSYNKLYSTYSEITSDATVFKNANSLTYQMTMADGKAIFTNAGTYYFYLVVNATVNNVATNGVGTLTITVDNAPTFTLAGNGNVPNKVQNIYNSSQAKTNDILSVTVGPTNQPQATSQGANLSYTYQWYYSTSYDSNSPSDLTSNTNVHLIPNATSNTYNFKANNVANSSNQTFNQVVGSNGGKVYLYLEITGSNSYGASTSQYYGAYAFSIQNIPSIKIKLPTSTIKVYYGTTTNFQSIIPTLIPNNSSDNPLTNSDFTISYLWQWKFPGGSWNINNYSGNTDSILSIGTAFTQSQSFQNKTLDIQLSVTITSNLDGVSQTFVSSNNATLNIVTLPLLTITPTSSLNISGYVNQTTNFPTISYQVNGAISGFEFNYELYSTTNKGWALSNAGIWGLTGWANVETISSTTSSSFSYTLTSSDFSSAQTTYYILAVKITYNGASTIQYWTGWTGSKSTATSAASSVYVLTVNNLPKPTVTLPSISSFNWYKTQTTPITLSPTIAPGTAAASLSYQWIITSYLTPGSKSATTAYVPADKISEFSSIGWTTSTPGVPVLSQYNGTNPSLEIDPQYITSGLFEQYGIPLEVGVVYYVVLRVTSNVNGASSTTTSDQFSLTLNALENAKITIPPDNSFTWYNGQSSPMVLSPTITPGTAAASLSYQWIITSYLTPGSKSATTAYVPADKISEFSNIGWTTSTPGVPVLSQYNGTNPSLEIDPQYITSGLFEQYGIPLEVGVVYYVVLRVTSTINGASTYIDSNPYSLTYGQFPTPTLTLTSSVSSVYNGQSTNLPLLSVSLANSKELTGYSISYTWYISFSYSYKSFLTFLGNGASFQTNYSNFSSYAYSQPATPYFLVVVQITAPNGYSESFMSSQTSLKNLSDTTSANLSNPSSLTNGFIPITINPKPTLTINSSSQSISIIKNQLVPVTFAPTSYDIVNANNVSITNGSNIYTYTFQWYENTTNSTSGGTTIANATSPALQLTNSSSYFQNSGTYYFYLKINATYNGITLTTQTSAIYTLTVNNIPALTINLSYKDIQVYANQVNNLPSLSITTNGTNKEFSNYSIQYNWYVVYTTASASSVASGQQATYLGSGINLQLSQTLLSYLYSSFNSGKSSIAYIFVQGVVTSQTGAVVYSYSANTINSLSSSNIVSGTLSNENGYVTIKCVTLPTVNIDSSNNAKVTAYYNQTATVFFQPENITLSGNILNKSYVYTYQWYVMPTSDTNPQGSAQADSGGSAISGANSNILTITNGSSYFTSPNNYFFYLAVYATIDGVQTATTYSNYYNLDVLNIPTLTFDIKNQTYNIYNKQTQNLPLLVANTNFSDSSFNNMTITYNWYTTYTLSGEVYQVNSGSGSVFQTTKEVFDHYANQNTSGEVYVFLCATITTSTGASKTFWSSPNISGIKDGSLEGTLSGNTGYFQFNVYTYPTVTISGNYGTSSAFVKSSSTITFQPDSISFSTKLLDSSVATYSYEWYDLKNPSSTPSSSSSSISSTTPPVSGAVVAAGTYDNYSYNVDSIYLSSVQTNYFYVGITIEISGYTIGTYYSGIFGLKTVALPTISPNSSYWANTATVDYYQNQSDNGTLAPLFITPNNGENGLTYSYQWYENIGGTGLIGNVKNIGSGQNVFELNKFFASKSSYNGNQTLTYGTYYIYLTIFQYLDNVQVGNANVAFYTVNYYPTPTLTFSSQSTTSTVYTGQTNSLSLFSGAYAEVNNTPILNGLVTYQWYSNKTNSTSGGSEIQTDGTNQFYTIDSFENVAVGTYYYYVVATFTINGGFSPIITKTSSVYTVNVIALPTLKVTQLESQKWNSAQTAVNVYASTTTDQVWLSPIITSSNPFATGVSTSLQWYYYKGTDTTSISKFSEVNVNNGGTAQSLQLGNFVNTYSGTYQFILEVILNVNGLKVPYYSPVYFVNFNAAPTISISQVEPEIYTSVISNGSSNVNIGAFSAIANIGAINVYSNKWETVQATLSYQWYENNKPISGATSAYYNIMQNNALLATAGIYTYYVIVSTTFQGLTITKQSNDYYLYVMGAPSIPSGINYSTNNQSWYGFSSTTANSNIPVPSNDKRADAFWQTTLTYSASGSNDFWIRVNAASMNLPTKVDPYYSDITYQWQVATINQYGFYKWDNLVGQTSNILKQSFGVDSNPNLFYRVIVAQKAFPDNTLTSGVYVFNINYGSASVASTNLDNYMQNLGNQYFVLRTYLTNNQSESWSSVQQEMQTGSTVNYGEGNQLFNFLLNSSSSISGGYYMYDFWPEPGTNYGTALNQGNSSIPVSFYLLNNGLDLNKALYQITNISYVLSGSKPYGWLPTLGSYTLNNSITYEKGIPVNTFEIQGVLLQPIQYNLYSNNYALGPGTPTTYTMAKGTQFSILLPFGINSSWFFRNASGAFNYLFFNVNADNTSKNDSYSSLSWSGPTGASSFQYTPNSLWAVFGNINETPGQSIKTKQAPAFSYGVITGNDPITNIVLYYINVNYSSEITSNNSALPDYPSWSTFN